MKIRRIVCFFCRIVLAGVFIAAALPKLTHPHDFALAVFRYQLAPYALVNIIAVALPWIELVAGVALLFARRLRDAAALLIFGMLLFFAVAMTINIFRGIDVACGCFSVNPDVSHIGWINTARNVILMIMAAVVFLDAWRAKA